MTAIGLLSVRLHIPMCSSLKEKRKILKSLKDRLHNKFNVSVSETDNHDKWQLADISCANVSTDKAHANSVLSNALNFIEEFQGSEVIGHRIELF